MRNNEDDENYQLFSNGGKVSAPDHNQPAQNDHL